MIRASAPIATLQELRAHLQYAIGLELTTVPTYLCALYSIDDGANTAAYETIQSVVLEEMLHMALAANVLNGIGGVPSTGPVDGGPSPVPVYPTKVSYIDRIPEIHLMPFTPAAIEEFLAIEFPDEPSASVGEQYASIGAFYAAIETGLQHLCPPEVFAEARVSRAGCQLGPQHYYGGAGTLIEVSDLKSALAALAEIVREGEGVPSEVLANTAEHHLLDGARTPGRLPRAYSVDDLDQLPFGWKMYSHYARFAEVQAGRHYLPDQLIGEEPRGDVLPIDWRAVRPMAPDPTAQQYAGTPAYAPLMAFNQGYTDLVDAVYRSFNGTPAALGEAVRLMYALKYQAVALMHTPSPLHPGQTLGPPFEYLHRT
jgi:Ferritin-like